jgi:hypothetical protein
MFIVHASFVSLLWVVCQRLASVSVDKLTEVLEDGSVIHRLRNRNSTSGMPHQE